jgi:hypothetical protein
MPDFLFDFQKALVEWAVRRGRGAIFASCGLGKTAVQLTWAENVVRHTNGRVLVLAPLAVAAQTVREGAKFGIEVNRSMDGRNVRPGINVTNYERLHHFDPNDFVGVVCDESGCIKHFGGHTQSTVTEFMKKMPYRLLTTATPSPNDYIELGTSAEALGELGRMDMLATYFKNDENSLHPIFWGARWQFKAHAERLFWRWLCSWARAVRKPSDLGFDDSAFELPPLVMNETVVARREAFNGQLFALPAIGLDDQREERRMTLAERCEMVAEKCEGKDSSIAWGALNAETDLLEKLIPGAVQVSGSDPDERKEEVFRAFVDGEVRVLVTKSKIAGWGLNFQHCAHMTFFPSHSYEAYHQSVRRCHRFGQNRPVVVDIIATEAEINVMKNLQAKSEAADRMYDALVREMNNELRVDRASIAVGEVSVPSWL